MVRTIETSPTGACRFYATGARNSSATFYWNGVGSPLYLQVGGKLHRIEHASADGNYDTKAAAMRAIRAFMGRTERQPNLRTNVPNSDGSIVVALERDFDYDNWIIGVKIDGVWNDSREAHNYDDAKAIYADYLAAHCY